MQALFVSDLDGTLIQADERLSPFARNGLARLLAAGLPFTVASARSVASMRPIVAGLPLVLPVVEFNGTMATWLDGGKRAFCHVLDPSAARAAAEAGVRAGTPPFVSTGAANAADDGLYVPRGRNDGMDQYLANRTAAGDYRLRPDARMEDGLDGRVVCLTFIDRRPRLEPLARLVAESQPGAFTPSFFENAYAPGWWWLTLHPPLANKAEAVARLAAASGVPLRAVTVFGDHLNDLPMFRAVGNAVAVAGAVPELLAEADEVIGPVTDDAVVRWLIARWPA
jgi:hydroxymethylpyrimidine pyrophosphatase-like HAD family hydrolase